MKGVEKTACHRWEANPHLPHLNTRVDVLPIALLLQLRPRALST